MDFIRKLLEAMSQAKRQPTQNPLADMVVVGRLTEEELLQFRQLDVLEQEMKDLARQMNLKAMEMNFRKTSFFDGLKRRMGVTFASVMNITEDYLVRIPRGEAAKHGVISQ